MRLIRVDTLTDYAWEAMGYLQGDTDRKLMATVTDHYLLGMPSLTSLPLAVIGVMPGSLLSKHTVLWFGMFNGSEPKLGDLRQSRAAMEAYFLEHSDTYFQAEVKLGDAPGAKFAKFFGFQPVLETADRTLYEREI